jgi:hypothetical protein
VRLVRFGAGVLALALGAGALAAQQPGPPQHPQGHRMDSAMAGRPGMADQMGMMDSMDKRLDSMVTRMNGAMGSRKMAAMADVINEMVAQRKAMQAHMHQMMDSRAAMMQTMPMMHDSAPVSPAPGAPRADSAAADMEGCGGHQPPK